MNAALNRRISLISSTFVSFFATIVSNTLVLSLTIASQHASADHLERRTFIADSSGNVLTAVTDILLPDGRYQRVLLVRPPGQVRGTLVMFPGGAGNIDVQANGKIEHPDNFVVRTRDAWIERGYAVVLVDAIDHRDMRGVRSSPAYAAVTQSIVAFAKAETNAPVWVMGTSQGSIAAMNAASHARSGSINGVILTESVTVLGGSHETVFDADPRGVKVPALVVANDDDRCRVAPAAMAPSIAAAMKNSRAGVLRVRGGEAQSADACGSLTPHGYFGIESQVVDGIASWMTRQHS